MSVNPSAEHDDLLTALAKHRDLLRLTVRGLTDEQAALTPTASELCLGGLIKHVSRMETRWCDFIVGGPSAMTISEATFADHVASFRMADGDTLASILEGYDDVARRTDELLTSLPDLGASQPLPESPWFEPGAQWSARRVAIHIIAETAQHAGHADILRETIDGQKSMG